MPGLFTMAPTARTSPLRTNQVMLRGFRALLLLELTDLASGAQIGNTLSSQRQQFLAPLQQQRGRNDSAAHAATIVTAAAEAGGAAEPQAPPQPTMDEARAVIAAIRGSAGQPPIAAPTEGLPAMLPPGIADEAARMAASILGISDALPKTNQTAAPAYVPSVLQPGEPRRGPVRPPPCAAGPPNLTDSDVSMALAPFKPAGAIGSPQHTDDGGLLWALADGGWAMQYPKLAVRMEQTGKVWIAWANPSYIVNFDRGGASYHVGDVVVHRSAMGDLVYHQATGTVFHSGQLLVYHWCHPNTIVYQTPVGLIYHDDSGLTYRGAGGIAHYAANGDLLYQGIGGITYQRPDGSVTHWTSSGAIYRHPDGNVTYTAVGESTPHQMPLGALGSDPFPGPPLTIEEVQKLVSEEASQEASFMAPAPAPAVVSAFTLAAS